MTGFGRVHCLILALLLTSTAMLGTAGPSHPPQDGLAKLIKSTIDFTPNGTQPGLMIAIEGNDSCVTCHTGNNNDSTQMAWPSWSGSMMANAARDPMFYAALDIANKDVPGIGDFVNGTNACLMEGTYDQQDSKGNDYAGVGCHFCHRTMEKGPTGQAPIVFNANFWFDDAISCTVGGQTAFGPCRRGPYAYPDTTPTGTVNAPHAWQKDTHYQKSEYCGTCHDVSSPDTNTGFLKTLILNDGTNTGRAFPLDRTYSEWKNSSYADVLLRDGLENTGPSSGRAYGETCQSCHMPVSTQATARACSLTSPGTRTNNLPIHEFVGANAFMVNVIKQLYGSTAGLDREAAFDRTLGWINQMLTQRSALIAVNPQPLASGATNWNVAVRVTNLSGHKLPAGYTEGRRMWLNLVVRDATNAIVFESGAYNPSTAALGTDSQAKVYEAVQGVWERFGNTGQCVTKENVTNRKLFNMALNNCIVKDNRIPPLGFRGGSDVELRPVGYSYPETAPGSGVLVNFDVTNYVIPVAAGAVRPLSVTATLKHQVMSKDYADFLKTEATAASIPTENAMCGRSWTVGPANKTRGEFMFDAWTNFGKSAPVDMVSATAASASAPGIFVSAKAKQ
jgi:hypothetical protein